MLIVLLKAGLIHGDMAQFDRTQVINDFKKHDMPILVATDVAGQFDMSSFFCMDDDFDLFSSWS